MEIFFEEKSGRIIVVGYPCMDREFWNVFRPELNLARKDHDLFVKQSVVSDTCSESV